MADYERSLAESSSPPAEDPRFRQQALVNGAEILADVEESVRANTLRINDGYKRLAWAIGETRAASEMSPADSMRAAAVFSNVTVRVLARHLEDDPSLLPAFTTAIIALNESISRRIRETTLAYTWYLLDRIHQAHLDERHRVARELHDRLGEGVSGALRQLELYELTEADQPTGPAFSTLAKGALSEAMDRLRLIISGLRHDPVAGLEKALEEFIAAAATDVDVRLRVSGDESWVPPTIMDETFLIVREAVRNALAHAAPQLLLIGVDLAPHELRALVEDDGRGFDLHGHDLHGSAGLAGMRERAVLVGGSLNVTSSPGHGTQVELLVPLPGPRDDGPSGPAPDAPS
jgi:signal transduction histidine kinase